MSDHLPFDPAPRAGEVASILARGRRRKATRLAVPVSTVALAAVAFSVFTAPTPRSDQQLQIADDPLTPATETAAATPSAAPAPAVPPDAQPAPQPAPSPTSVVLPPPLGASPSPSRSPRPEPSGRPGERRPYRGELGPRVEEYRYPDCRQSQLEAGSRTTTRAGFCIQPTFRTPAATGVTDLAPTLRFCWPLEVHYYGFLEFATQEEADFALYEADVDDAGRTVLGRKIYRFSDSVTYKKRPHSYRVLQGDCWVWQGRVDFDAARLGAGSYLLRLETKSTTFEPQHRTYDFEFDV